MFDDSIRLVVWGHEHDCRIVPEPVAGKNYYITQPGSSVATSLADGESIEKLVPRILFVYKPLNGSTRHVALLKIEGKEFQMEPLPLRTVRPFVIEQVVLNEVADEEGLNISDQMEISKYLKAKVTCAPFFLIGLRSCYSLWALGQCSDRSGQRALGRTEYKSSRRGRRRIASNASSHPTQGS